MLVRDHAYPIQSISSTGLLGTLAAGAAMKYHPRSEQGVQWCGRKGSRKIDITSIVLEEQGSSSPLSGAARGLESPTNIV
jgi:hypothetical protein